MKSITSLLSIIVLGFGLFGCAAKEEVPIANTGAAAPYGVVGIGYSETLTAICSTVPLPWTLSSGVLPPGLNNFDGATGVVGGIPNVAGNVTVVFAGTNSTGKTENCSVSFVVRPGMDRVSVDIIGNSVFGTVNTEPSISEIDGRYIAFTSAPSILSPGASLIAGVTGQQIYLHDRQTGRLSLVSQDNFGTPGFGGTSSAASVSADGRFIVFVSTATNLVPGVSGPQIYLHDTQPAPNGRTTLVSKDASGSPASTTGFSPLSNTSPRISGDGRFIVFVSTATNLVSGVTGQQIYLHDTQPAPNGQTTLVSKDASGSPASTGSSNLSPTISADGRFIAFVSTATNLVSGVTAQQIYRHDTQTSLSLPSGQTTLVSKDASGNPASTGSSNLSPTISADGRFIAFVSTATNLVSGVTGQQIYLHDTQPAPNGRTTLVSKDASGSPASTTGFPTLSNTSPRISADGRFIAFVSTATNLVSGVSGQQIYLHDFVGNVTRLVSQDNAGIPASTGSPIIVLSNTSPTISADGRFVAFVSSATNLVTAPPAAAAFDVYVRAMP
jgi:Tol biopolymer transport system component